MTKKRIAARLLLMFPLLVGVPPLLLSGCGGESKTTGTVGEETTEQKETAEKSSQGYENVPPPPKAP